MSDMTIRQLNEANKAIMEDTVETFYNKARHLWIDAHPDEKMNEEAFKIFISVMFLAISDKLKKKIGY